MTEFVKISIQVTGSTIIARGLIRCMAGYALSDTPLAKRGLREIIVGCIVLGIGTLIRNY